MKKSSTIALLLMLSLGVFAEKVYFKTTSATSWWATDGAKIAALFKVDNTDEGFGAFTSFFVAVDGEQGLYAADVPANADKFVAVKFLRYQDTATDPSQKLWWNATQLERWDGVKNLFTAIKNGEQWDSTTGNWSVYTKTPVNGEVIYLDCTSFDGGNNWSVSGAKIGAMFTDGSNSAYTDFMQFDAKTGLYYAQVPAGSWNTVIFFRYNSAATQTGWADFWNRTCEAGYAGQNKFVITGWQGCSDSRDSEQHCAGKWETLGQVMPATSDTVKIEKTILINGVKFHVAGNKTYYEGAEVK